VCIRLLGILLIIKNGTNLFSVLLLSRVVAVVWYSVYRETVSEVLVENSVSISSEGCVLTLVEIG